MLEIKVHATYIIAIIFFSGVLSPGFRLSSISRSNIFIMTANSQGQDQSWGWLLY